MRDADPQPYTPRTPVRSERRVLVPAVVTTEDMAWLKAWDGALSGAYGAHLPWDAEGRVQIVWFAHLGGFGG